MSECLSSDPARCASEPGTAVRNADGADVPISDHFEAVLTALSGVTTSEAFRPGAADGPDGPGTADGTEIVGKRKGV